jgi:tight adherence protein B
VVPAGPLALLAASLVVALLGMLQLVRHRAGVAAVAGRSVIEERGIRSERPLAGLERRIRATAYGRNLALRLSGAGEDLGVLPFLGMAAALGLAGYLVAESILATWLGLVVGVLSTRLATVWLERKRERRRVAFVGQLPDLARILSNATSAGLSIRTAVEMAASELDDPAGAEMRIVAEQFRIGQPVEAALTDLERRMPSREVGVLVTTLIIQQRSGGDVVRALQDMAVTLEARRDLIREVRTMMTGSVYAGYVVAALGLFFVAGLNVFSPGITEEITRPGPALVAVGFAVALYAVGFLLMRRITRVEI